MKLKTLLLVALFTIISVFTAQAQVAIDDPMSPPTLMEQTGLPGTLPVNMNLVKAGPSTFLIDAKGNSHFSCALSWIDLAVGEKMDLKAQVQKIADSEKDQNTATIVTESYSGVTAYTLHRSFIAQGQIAYGMSSYVMYNNRVYAFHFGENNNNAELEKMKNQILMSVFKK